MRSSIKINSISIDLAGANETDAGKCDHFSIRGFVAEIRERDHRKCWPFSEDSVELRNHQSYSLPSLSILKSRWWRSASCIRDINDKEINNDNDKLSKHIDYYLCINNSNSFDFVFQIVNCNHTRGLIRRRNLMLIL